MPSKRKHQDIESHRKKNCKADYLKRKLGGFEIETYDEPECGADVDYVKFLINNMKFTSADDNFERVNDDAIDSDPQYEIFLNGLKQDGNTWLVQADENNGLPVSLMYGREDGSDDELDQDIARKMKNTMGGNIEDARINSSYISNLEDPVVLDGLPENQKRKAVIENGMESDLSEPINPNPSGVEQWLVEELGTEGSYSPDRQRSIDMQGGSAEECNSDIVRTLEKVAKGGKSEAAVNLENKKDENCDDDYSFYINSLICTGKNLVLKYKDAKPIEYEGDNLKNVRTNNGTRITKGNRIKKGNRKLPARVVGSDACVERNDTVQCLGSPSRERHSLFREQVMTILREPYDLKEHQSLSDRLIDRKPIHRNMDLRFGREQSFLLNKDGKSYLDHYPDLKRKIAAAKGSRKELNLLRGFFFWIQNLTREGAFKPWLDASCLGTSFGI